MLLGQNSIVIHEILLLVDHQDKDINSSDFLKGSTFHKQLSGIFPRHMQRT